MSITSEDSYDFASDLSDVSDGEVTSSRPLPTSAPQALQNVFEMNSWTTIQSNTVQPSKYVLMFVATVAVSFCVLVCALLVFYAQPGRRATMYEYMHGQFDESDYRRIKQENSQSSLQELKAIEQAEKITKALEKFNSMTYNEQLEINKWMPLPETFEGLQEYLEEIGQTGTKIEKFMYHSRPYFKVCDSSFTALMFEMGCMQHLQHIMTPTKPTQHAPESPNDTRYFGGRHQNSMTITVNAQLNITDIAYKGDKRMVFTRLYYLPIVDLLNLV